MESRQLATGIAKGRAKNLASYHWGPWRAILMSVSLLMILLAVPQLIGTPELHSSWPLYVSLASVAWLATFFICSYGQFKTAYLLTSAYIILLCLFHLGGVIPTAFGWTDTTGMDFGTFAPWLERAGWYTVLALACTGVGFSMALKRTNFKIQKHVVSEVSANKVLDMIYWDGIGLLIASLIFLGMAIASFGNLLNYSRVDFFRLGAGDTRGLGAFTMVLPVALIFLVLGARKQSSKIFSYSIAAVFFILLLLSGSRSNALIPLLVGVVLWVKLGRKIPLPIALAALAFVLIAIPAVGLLRSSGEAFNKIDQTDILKSTENAKIGAGFSEMGSTSNVLASIIRLVPVKDPYRYGATYLKAVLESLPNIGFKQSGSDRVKAIQEVQTNPEALLSLIPSDWITYRLDPGKFEAGEGVGFSIIGEPYINFGLVGVIIFFTAAGFWLGRLESISILNSSRVFVLTGVIAWPLLTLVRNDFVTFIKPIVFTLIVLFIWRIASKFLLGKIWKFDKM